MTKAVFRKLSRRNPGSLIRISVAGIAAVIACMTFVTPAWAQADAPVACVKRSTTAEPPPFPAGPQRKTRKGETYGDATADTSAFKPLCPEGEVPVVKEFRPDNPGEAKGNPLIAPELRNTPLRDFRQRKRLRGFREVYRPRAGRNPPPPPPGDPACDGIWQDGACYYYATAAFTTKADGGGMTTTVARPTYVNTGGSGHSLNEIAIQAGKNNGDIIELGWLVSSNQYGDLDPHIFVFHWIGGTPTCYDGCNWQQYSGTYHPGQNIKAIVGREVYVGYVFYNGNWWAWFDNQWLGYYPGTEWNKAFTKTALIQWFGEVASLNGVPPKTAMGTDVLPPAENAAHMFTLCDVDAPRWICWYRDQQSLQATVKKYYDIQRVGFGATRYGGPGQ